MILKFRAFSNGKWWYSDDEAYLLKEYDGELFLVEDTQFYLSDSPRYSKIGKAIQFTGLCDKNGKEIYEGDICQEVEYEGRGDIYLCDHSKNFKYDGEDLYAFNETLEIIGNIHEGEN